MAIIAEELGFIGVLIVIGLLVLIVLRGMFIARKCKDSFGALLAIGISSMVGIQALINLGSTSGLLPITGVPLPFVSYGGSSLDRKSTRLNSSHVAISYAVFCLKKKMTKQHM